MNHQANQLAQMKMQCQQHMNQPVHVQVHGEHGYNGIIEHVDDENVYLLVPVNEHGQYMDLAEIMMSEQANQANQPMMRQFYPFFQPYPFFYGYPRPYGWNRLVLPLAALTALAVLF